MNDTLQCNHAANWVRNVPYEQHAIEHNVQHHDAERQCANHAHRRGRDFFVQQHHNGHTICGFFARPLEHEDSLDRHGHRFGSVCRTRLQPGESFGWHPSGRVVNFRADGSDGTQTGMTKTQCATIGMQQGWEVVGHRNESHPNAAMRNTCWKHVNYDRASFNEFHARDGNPRDRAHVTMSLFTP